MLTTMRSSWLLCALLALIAVSSALSIEEALHLDGIEAYLHHGIKRQASGTGSITSIDDPDSTPTPTDETSEEPTTTSQSSTTTRPTTTATTTTSNPPDDEETTTGPTTGSTPRPTPPGNNNNQPPTTTTQDPADEETTSEPPTRVTTPIVRTTPTTSTAVQEYTTIIRTISNGQELDVTSTGSSTSLVTSAVEVTELPSPQDGGDSGGSDGLSESNKKIIGGVVGGVGGAILLGGIALVCWRIWGRKRRVTEDDADLMANTGAALGDKPATNASPFQSNLEQYHNPGGRPNAAANF